MKILFIVGTCLQSNSSANLCHMSYIRGALAAGHDVEVVCVSNKDMPIDKGIQLPQKVTWHFYDSAFYTRYSYRKSRNEREYISSGEAGTTEQRMKKSFVRRLKDWYIDSQGIYGFDSTWIKKSSRFVSEKLYDVVFSLAYPPASHEVARQLIMKEHICTQCWCQIWEDPWYLDLWMKKDIAKRDEEEKLIAAADRVMYVSPITLKYQQKEFAMYRDKMFWMPLPYYYETEFETENRNAEKVFGYFGDFHAKIRDLSPFYQAAKMTEVKTYIVGNPANLFTETENVKVIPRVGVEKLKEYEKKTNVLVFLCNIKGGQIPGKLYQYSSTNKLIFFILDGTKEEVEEIRSIYSKYNRYIFCENNVESIKEGIDKILRNDTENVVNEKVVEFSPRCVVTDILNNIKG